VSSDGLKCMSATMPPRLGNFRGNCRNFRFITEIMTQAITRAVTMSKSAVSSLSINAST
jgi:hypothetical protein